MGAVLDLVVMVKVQIKGEALCQMDSHKNKILLMCEF